MSLNPGVARGQIGSAAISKALEEAVRADGFAVADLPAAADHEGKIVYVSDGNAGDPCLGYSDGTDWLVIALGAAVAAA